MCKTRIPIRFEILHDVKSTILTHNYIFKSNAPLTNQPPGSDQGFKVIAF